MMEDNKDKFDYKSLSITKQYIWKLCKQILKDLKSGECTEEQANNIMSNINAEKSGYINPDDYLSSENAMKYLGVHRNQFFSLVKEYDIQCKKINGHPIGYYKKDLQRIRNGNL
jgi:hypothetical protein